MYRGGYEPYSLPLDDYDSGPVEGEMEEVLDPSPHKGRGLFFGGFGHGHSSQGLREKHSKTKFKILGIPIFSKTHRVREGVWNDRVSHSSGFHHSPPAVGIPNLISPWPCPTCF